MLALTIVAGVAVAKKKKKKKDEEPVTQTLPVLQDPPLAVVTDAELLVFRVAPLSPKGLLSQQVRDALKFLIQNSRGATIVKLRAFVAGTGDLRRVQTIVSELFSDRKLFIPALSTIQGGLLPGEGVQVVIEAIEAQKKPANPEGLAFISAQSGGNIQESLDRVQTAVTALGLGPDSVRQTTCFVSTLDNYTDLKQAVTAAFPAAALNVVQMQRVPVSIGAACEAVAALERAPSPRVEFVNPDRLAKSPEDSQITLIGPGRLAISGLQLGFGTEDKDIRLAFERLGKALDAIQTSLKDVVYTRFYPVSDQAAAKIRSLRFDFLDKSRPPGSTLLPFEALQSLDASFGMEVMAAK